MSRVCRYCLLPFADWLTIPKLDSGKDRTLFAGHEGRPRQPGVTHKRYVFWLLRRSDEGFGSIPGNLVHA